MILFWVVIGLMSLLAMGIVLLPLLSASALRGKKIVLWILFASVIPITAILLYRQWGASQAWSADREAKTLWRQWGTPDQVISSMRTYLQKHPRDAKAWYLLGRLYLSEGNRPAAEHAFKKAHDLVKQLPNS